ncbi:hypothetical protein BJX70DRAFT_394264 [Aspergillus crustosus]
MRFVLLVGIAGGAPSPKHDVRLGDVILGTKIVPYATGKETDDGFERTGTVKAPATELLSAITFLDERMWLEELVLSESIESIRTKGGRGATDFVRPPCNRLYSIEPHTSMKSLNVIVCRLNRSEGTHYVRGTVVWEGRFDCSKEALDPRTLS